MMWKEVETKNSQILSYAVNLHRATTVKLDEVSKVR